MSIDKKETCRNCDSVLYGRYCYRCGQKNIKINSSVWQLINEFFGELFTFDNRFFKTLKPLILSPGKVTLEYNDGKRARYMPLVKLYLFVSFAMFLLLNIADSDVIRINMGDEDSHPKQAEKVASPHAEIVGLIKSIKAVDSDKEKPNLIQLKGQAMASFYSAIDDQAEKVGIFAADAEDLSPPPKRVKRVKRKKKQLSGFEKFISDLFKKAMKRMRDSGKTSDEIRAEVINRLPQMMFFLLPFFALLLKLVYIRRNSYYIHHLVFTVHLHTYAFLVFFTLGLLSFVEFTGVDILAIILLVSIPLYLLRGLKRIYRQSWFKTLLKSILIAFVYLIVFTFSFFALFILSVLYL